MHLNILISSAGRRVALANCFRDSVSALGIEGRIIAIDATPHCAAGQLADAFYVVPRCTEPDFLDEVQDVCEREAVHLIVPTIDTELPVYSSARERFRRIGTEIGISGPEAIAICEDKSVTYNWLASQGFPVPRQSTPEAVLRNCSEWELPLILKPKHGSASVGVRSIASHAELQALADTMDGLLVQEFLSGTEYTTNVFVTRDRRCLCAVPHARLEIRGGEVSKGITVRHPPLINLVRKVVEALPGAYGPLNVQSFVRGSDDIRIIEINARFGGGYPLSHRAGAELTRYLLEQTIGVEPQGPFDDWEEGLVMLRYDAAVFIPPANLSSESYVKSMYRVRS